MGNNILTKNDIPQEYSGYVVQLAKILNFTALGVLAVLINEFSEGFGIINISKMAKACGSSRSAFTAQLRILEKNSIIRMGATYREGRELIITCIKTNLSRDIAKNKFKESRSTEISNYYNDKSILAEPSEISISAEYTEIEKKEGNSQKKETPVPEPAVQVEEKPKDLMPHAEEKKRPHSWGPPKPPMFPETILPGGRKAIYSEYGATGFEIFTEQEKAEMAKKEAEKNIRQGEKR
jgi:hypothetical protein